MSIEILGYADDRETAMAALEKLGVVAVNPDVTVEVPGFWEWQGKDEDGEDSGFATQDEKDIPEGVEANWVEPRSYVNPGYVQFLPMGNYNDEGMGDLPGYHFNMRFMGEDAQEWATKLLKGSVKPRLVRGAVGVKEGYETEPGVRFFDATTVANRRNVWA